MDPIAKLLAIEEIKSLKARYWRTLDTKDWEGYRDVFATDGVLLFPEMKDGSMGIDAAMPWTIAFLKGSVSIHHGTAPEIEVLTETTARGIWQIEDEIFWNANATGSAGITYLHGHGHYHETYELSPKGWRIKTLRLSRLRLVTERHGIEISSSDR